MNTEKVRLLRRSVDPLGQGDASADKGGLGPIGADSSCGRDAPVTHADMKSCDICEARAEALAAERDALARRITRLRGEMGDALIHCSKGCNWPLDLVPGCHPCQILSDALAIDDQRAQGEGT